MSDDYINSYQRWQDETVWPTVRDDILWAGTGLASEVGELCQLLEKQVRKGKQPSQSDVESELGDILWYVSNIANLYDLKLSEIMKNNIDKIERRRDGR